MPKPIPPSPAPEPASRSPLGDAELPRPTKREVGTPAPHASPVQEAKAAISIPAEKKKGRLPEVAPLGLHAGTAGCRHGRGGCRFESCRRDLSARGSMWRAPVVGADMAIAKAAATRFLSKIRMDTSS